MSFEFLKNLRKKTPEEFRPFLEELDKSDKLIHEGKFDLAYENLKKTLEFSIPDQELKFEIELSLHLVQIFKGDLQSPEDPLKEIVKKSEILDSKNNLALFYSKAYLSLLYLERREIELAFPLIDECITLKNHTRFRSKDKKTQAEGLLFTLSGKYYALKRELKESISNFEDSLEIYKSFAFKFDLANNLKSVAIIYSQIGDFNKAIEYLIDSRNMFEQMGDKINFFKVVNNLGMVCWQKGELDDGTKYLREALHLSLELGNKQYTGVINLNLGLIQWQKGNLNSALPYLEKSREIFQELNIKPYLAQSIMNLSSVQATQGEIDAALKNLHEALEIQTELNNKEEIANVNHNIGNIYQIKRDYETSLNYCFKALEIVMESESKAKIIEYYFAIIQLFLFSNNLKEAKNHFTKMSSYISENSTKKDKQIYKMARGFLYKYEGRLIPVADAQQIFKEIGEEEIMISEVTISSMLNHCELLISEIKFFGNEEIIDELENIVSQLLVIAKKQNMPATLVESLILQSKLSLFEFDLKKSQELLQEAQKTAEDRGLENLAIVASIEYDSLLDKIESFDFSKDSKLSFVQRFGLDELEDLIQRMINKNVALLPKQMEEEPVLLLVVTEAGIPIFSKKFLKDSQFDDMLISGFLTAINSFIKEAFATQGAVERIKQKDYTLLFQQMDPLTFCYVIKGPSYAALKKMDRFMNTLRTSDLIWDEILESAETGRSLEDLDSLNDVTGRFFTVVN